MIWRVSRGRIELLSKRQHILKAIQQKDAAGGAFLLNPAVTLGAHAGAWAAGKGTSAASDVISGNLEFLGLLTAHVPFVGNMFSSLGEKFGSLSQKASNRAAIDDVVTHA